MKNTVPKLVTILATLVSVGESYEAMKLNTFTSKRVSFSITTSLAIKENKKIAHNKMPVATKNSMTEI
jgi:uncharacterized membrane protein